MDTLYKLVPEMKSTMDAYNNYILSYLDSKVYRYFAYC